MHKLRRFYYQNKEKVWKVALIIAAILAGIYFINYNIKPESNNSNQVVESQIYFDNENKTYISDKSAISGGEVTKQEAEQVHNTISKFLQYCKNEKYEEAYNIISLDCKEKHYQTLEKFIQNYAKSKFKKSDVYEVEKWINDTYRISISEDKLATGELGDGKMQTEYITIAKENSQDKLNINSYIGKRDIGKEVTQNNVRITVVSKETYFDYEVYNLKIENQSNKKIKIDAYKTANSIYLEDANGYKYNAYKHEILEEKLEIFSGAELEVPIKFAKTYTSNGNIRKIIFSNFVFDYEQYKKNTQDKQLYEFIINL